MLFLYKSVNYIRLRAGVRIGIVVRVRGSALGFGFRIRVGFSVKVRVRGGPGSWGKRVRIPLQG